MESHRWFDQYEEGVPQNINFEDIPLPSYLEKAVRNYPESNAIHFLNCTLTYRQLKEEVDRFATALAGLGVRKGTRVAVQAPNIPQTAIAFLAIQRLGAHAVMTNPLYMPREIEHQWNDAEVEVAITMDFIWDQKVRAIRDKVPVREFIIASVPEYLGFPLNLLAPLKLKKTDPPSIAKVKAEPGVHFFRKLVRSAAAAPPQVDISMDDIAVIQYTGGTTGVSKGAVLTHRNLSYNVQQVRSWFTGLEPGKEVLLAALPFFHIFGLTVCLTWPVAVGAAIVLQANPRDIDGMVKRIVKHRVTLFPALPALFNAINQYPNIENLDLSSVKRCFSGSAPLPEDIQTKFESLTGAIIVEGYGLTETSPVVTANPCMGKRKIGHIGLPIPGTDVRIVDPEGGLPEVPVGETGELIIRGPQVMQGYLNREQETSNTIRNGWLYTGDLATMDEEGYFKIVGRKKDMIIASGYNIYPDEIDRVLMAHEKVFESCTIGVPDQKRGETVKAFIVLQPGETVTAEELKKYCSKEMAAYKVPRQWEFREDLPKSAMMKLLRRELRDEEIAKQQADA
ncbi:MAG: long-chain fatty acid--CoA ligase [Planctomycetota bacterium]|nr:long-chain fatty acid--CoA ligase [Planctomycetota bacterium]MDA1113771.1 long-chain fatty acid--CoA ligase [Planctomycetota bacterium]